MYSSCWLSLPQDSAFMREFSNAMVGNIFYPLIRCDFKVVGIKDSDIPAADGRAITGCTSINILNLNFGKNIPRVVPEF
jgi:hypothetical protein